MVRAARWLLTTLLTIGLIGGVIRYVREDGAHGLIDFITSIVGGIADVTYRWLPPALDFLSSLLSRILGEAS